MKVKLSIKDDKNNEIVPQLKISFMMDGDDINVIGEDDKGEIYLIISLMGNGNLYRFGSIPNDIGLQVNRNGQILEAK